MANKSPEHQVALAASETVQSFFAPPLSYLGDWPLSPLPPVEMSDTTHDDKSPLTRDKDWPWGPNPPVFPEAAQLGISSPTRTGEGRLSGGNGSKFATFSLVYDGKDFCTRLHGRSGLETYRQWRTVLDNAIAREIHAATRVKSNIKLEETPEERERREWVPLQMSYIVMQRLVSLVEPGTVPADIVAKENDPRTALINLNDWVIENAHFEWRAPGNRVMRRRARREECLVAEGTAV